MTQSPSTSPTSWDLIAPAYTDELGASFEEFARDALSLAAPPAGSRIVDVACGPGSLAVLAARDGLVVDALDFSPAMIAQLDQRVAVEKLAITTRVGDGQALPYADATFDAGFAMFALMFFPDRAKGLSELRRVLAPGGRAVVATWTRLAETPAMDAMYAALRETLRTLMGAGAPQPGAGEMPLTTADSCRAEMSSVFSQVDVHRVPHDQVFPSADELWYSMVRTSVPLLTLRRNLGEDRWRAVDEAARSATANVLGPGEARITWTAWLSVGTAA
ncbi:MAG: methyltransferase domain-containing protein [Kofleriaceae bacterium]|nr:methyltransferase domain-containing protein [Kofleriaceae bacterium]